MKFLKFALGVLMIIAVLASCAPAPAAPPAATEAPAAAATEAPAAATEAPAAATEAPAAATEAPAAPAGDKFGGTLTFGIEVEPPGFNPIQHDSWYEIWIYSTSNEPLTHGGENFGTEWRPILAESWTTSDDGLVWTVNLRKNVTWQDGKPFTADDVIYWAEAIQSPDTIDTDWVQSRFFVNEKPFKFEKVDDYTITITTDAPVPNLMADICVPVIPKHYFEERDITFAEMDKSNFNTTDELLGTGPFRITEYKRGEAVIMTKYKDYWGGEPYLDQVVYRIIPDRASLLTALMTGEVDYITLEPKEVEQLAGADNVTIYQFEGDNSNHFRVNTLMPHLKDKRTRQALMYALDRQAIVDVDLLGYGRVSDTVFSPYVTAYKPMEKVYDYNPDKAKELLAEVGWVPGPDGVLIAENVEGIAKGEKFTLQIDVYSEGHKTISALAQDYWKAVGIDAVLRQRDRAVFRAANYATEIKPEQRDFNLFHTMIGSAGPNGVSYNWLMASPTPEDTIMGYVNPEVLALFDKAKSAKDPAERDELLNQAVAITWEDVPFISTYYSENLYAINKRVHFEETPIDATMWVQFPDISKVWVEK